MEERSETMSVGIKSEPNHNRRLSSESKSGSVGSVATPSPSSTPTSHLFSKTSNLTPGPSTQPVATAPIRQVSLEEDGGKTSKENGTSENDQDPIDQKSIAGIFGWDTVDDTNIPVLFRRGRKFVSVRIVECKLLSKYPNTIPEELASKDPLVSHFITEAEAKLLNEINTVHCDFEYGQSSFTMKDLIVDLEEFLEFFKIVKKNFPEDMLATMKGQGFQNQSPPQSLAPTPPASESAQYCGWVQINNTVSPYIIRSDGKDQVKLVPLSVIVYAAGLLTGSSVEGLLPTIEECTMLNAACKTAGFDFTFGRNTRLIAITEVVQRCQVKIFELPLANPLQHAHYLDNRYGQPPLSQSILNSSIRQPSPSFAANQLAHYANNPLGMDGQPPTGMFPGANPFLQRYPAHRLPGPPNPSSRLPGASRQANASTGGMSRLPSPPNCIVGVDSKGMPVPMHRSGNEKSSMGKLDSSSHLLKMMAGNPHFTPPQGWPLMPPGQVPPTHNKQKAMPQPPHEGMHHPPLSSPSSSAPSSSYQPMSLPPSPLLHSSHTSVDGSHPIYRNSSSGSVPRGNKEPRYPNMMGNKPGLPPPLPPHSQYSTTPSSPSFGVNQFNSSLFTRTESSSDHPKHRQPLSSSSSSSSASSSSLPSSLSSSSHLPNHPQSQNSRCNVQNSPLSHMLSSAPKPNRNIQQQQPNPGLVKNISACLVNGKSISCLHVDSPLRSGKFCLVEAVSKLYFPTVPIREFVNVLQVVLAANLHECTLEEEAAFVQYYNLPVPKLKCNQMIMVDDLQKYFPQLTYVFSKGLAEQTAAAASASSDMMHAGGGLKRQHSGGDSHSGPPSKQSAPPKLENVVQKLHHDRRPSAGSHDGPSDGAASSSVIVIDD